MRKLTLAGIFFLIAILTDAQILKIATNSSIISSQIPGYSEVTLINTKSYAYTPSIPLPDPTPIDEDSTTEDDKIYEYADMLFADFQMSDGNVTSTSAGKVWTLKISIQSALNIGLILNQFSLTPNAEMYIYNESKTVLDSAIRKEHFTNDSTITISSITGSSIVIYIIELGNMGTFQSVISIEKILAGYQPISEVGDVTSNISARTIACDPMIQCYPNKIPFARAVARIATEVSPGKFGYCTGTLINNELNNGRPYFLTAFHCLDRNKNHVIDQSEINLLTNTNFQFRFWRINCNGSVNNFFIEFTGASLRASSFNSDVSLLELRNPPGIGDLVNYAGWNRQTSSPSDNYSFIIHHPDAEDMRITTTSNVKTWLWNNNYWTAHYSLGTVEKGSSGSALMNENGQITGQLRGGWSNCNHPNNGDRYGKFDRSWSALQIWLSRTQNLQSTNLLDLTNIPINGPNNLACTSTSGTFSTLSGLLDVTYEWHVSNNLQVVSGQSTATVNIVIVNNTSNTGTITLILRSPTKGRNRIYTVSKTILLTKPEVYGNYFINGQEQPLRIWTGDPIDYNNACNLQNTSTNMQITGASSITWSKVTSSPSNISWSQNINNLNFYFWGIGQTAVFRIDATNGCGSTTYDFGFKSIDCSGGGGCFQYQVSPNPATGSVNIIVPNIPPPCDLSSLSNSQNSTVTQRTMTEIKIYDQSGTLKKIQKENKTRQATINVTGFNTGIYIIEISDGAYRERQQIAIRQ